MQEAVKSGANQRLALPDVLDWLVEDKLVGAEVAATLKKERRYYRGALHPLQIVAEQKWKNGAAALSLDYLSEWLAKRVGMPYFHIDPLKIDFSAVTEVMSSAYATRFRILPVEVTAKEVVIATAEPFVRDWEPELARMLRRSIKRVIANPVDIERYLVEFYNLAKSMKGAEVSHGGSPRPDQLRAAGRAGQERQAARRQRPAHRPHRRLAVAVRLRPARERHPHRAAARRGHRALPHRRRAAPGLPDARAGVLAAMTSRIKILGRMDVVEKRRPQDGRIKTRTPRRRARSSCACRRCRPRSARSW